MAKKKAEEERKHEGAYCINCKSPSAFYIYSPDDCQNYFGKPVRFHHASCKRCEAPALFAIDLDEDGEERGALNKIFPLHRNALSCTLPAEARRSYEEALVCEESGASLATVVMVGRTLEAVCKEHFPDSKNLTVFNGIERLHKDGVISDQLRSWADQLRVLRNIGAHASSDIVVVADAAEALDFLKAILENVYDLSPKFKQLVARRATNP